jgi:hypothetical protein
MQTIFSGFVTHGPKAAWSPLEPADVALSLEHRVDAGRRALAEILLGGNDVEDTALGAQPESETVAPPQRGKGHALGQLCRFGRSRATLGGGLGRQARTRHRGHADDAAGLEKRSAVVIHGSPPVSSPASLIGAAYAGGQ